ncbi:hypothetical protein EON65_05910 [archaeon]|nr:MAG: hypothetical protein EON65_05910 [archaeon]
MAVTRGTRSVIEYLLGLKKGAQSDISSVVFRDVLDVQKTYNREVALFQDKEFHMAAREKSRRLLYLFQKDLMPGICGQILESKDMRDNVKVKSVPGLAKTLAWTFLLVMNAVMLFYIYLFAVSQDEYRQTAWAQSFALWLVAEIFLISTCMVLVMNVAIPSVIMKDVQAIKTKLVGSLVEYHRQLQNDHQQDQKVDKMSKQSAQQFESNESSSKFNAAEYLFVSYRLAQTFMQLKTAKVIAHYQTVWPRQSYQHVADVSRSYNRSFTAFTRSASIIILFFVSNLLTVPITLQDMVVHAVTTAAAGYACLLHLQLYTIYPVLVVAPTLCILMVIHFFLQSHKTQQEGLHTLLQKAAESSRQQDKTKTKSNDLVDEDAQEGNNPEQQQVESALKYIYYGKKLRAFQQRKHEQAAKDIVNAGSRSNAGAGNKGSGLDDDDLLHFPRRAHDDIEEKSDDDSCSYSSDCRSSSGGSRNSSDSYRSADEKESDDDEYYDEVSYSIVPQPRYQANQHVGRRQSVQHGIEIMAAAQRHVYKSSSSNSGSSSASSSSEDGKKQSDSESSHSSQDSYDSEDIHSDDHDTEADEGKHVSSGGVNSIHNKDKSEYFDDDSEENADKMYSIENDGTIVYYDVHGVEQYRERANALDENTQSSSNQLDNGGYSYVCGSRDSYSYSDSESRSESDDDSDTP